MIKRSICKKGGVMMNKEKALWIYQKMNEIRHFEEEVRRIFAKGEIPGFVHLYAGEEAVATGVMALLDDGDYITSTHRVHGHDSGKVIVNERMMVEIKGKKDSLGDGKVGAMLDADVEKVMLGANRIVVGRFGLASCAALTIKTLKQEHVAFCFFGDVAANE